MTRIDHIHQARVYLREARARGKYPAQRGFCFVLLGWAKDIVRQCKEAGVSVLVKQLGARPTNREGEPHKISDRKGTIMQEWPEELRVREYPNAA